MNHATQDQSICYVSWIVGQSAAMLGVVLAVLWGFGLVFLMAAEQYAQATQTVSATAEGWHPPFGPPMLGLGLSLVAWLFAHERHLPIPAPVFVATAANLLALILAMAAGTF